MRDRLSICWLPLVLCMECRLKMCLDVDAESIRFDLKIGWIVDSRDFCCWFEVMQVLNNILEFRSRLLLTLLTDPCLLCFIVIYEFLLSFLVFISDEFDVALPGKVIMYVHPAVIPSEIALNNTGLIVKIFLIFRCEKDLCFLEK